MTVTHSGSSYVKTETTSYFLSGLHLKSSGFSAKGLPSSNVKKMSFLISVKTVSHVMQFYPFSHASRSLARQSAINFSKSVESHSVRAAKI